MKTRIWIEERPITEIRYYPRCSDCASWGLPCRTRKEAEDWAEHHRKLHAKGLSV